MNESLNNNKENKEINRFNLRIQLRNYNAINPKSLAIDGIQNKKKNREKKREWKKTKLGTPKGSKTPKSRACSSASSLVSLYRNWTRLFYC